MADKPGDDCVVPLCASCHARQHSIGEPLFWGQAIGSAKWLAKKLYEFSGDGNAAIKYIQTFRRDA